MLSKSAIEAARSYGFVLIKSIPPQREKQELSSGFPLHQLHVETETLQFPNEHVERLWNTGFHGRFTFYDCFVNLRTAVDIVGLGGQQLLKNVCRAVCFKRPDFHFTEPLSAELCLAAERLLGDQRIGSDRSGMDLVVHQMGELEHVDVAHRHFLLEGLAGHTVVQASPARLRQIRLLQHGLDFSLQSAVEYWCCVIQAECLCGPAKMGFENLPDVHSRRYAKRIKYDLDGFSIGKVRHILFGQDPGDNALVAVAAGHLVANGKLALHGDVDFDQLDDSRRQFIAASKLRNSFFVNFTKHIDLAGCHLLDFLDLIIDVCAVDVLQLQEFTKREMLDDLSVHLGLLCNDLSTAAFIDKLVGRHLSGEQSQQALVALIGKDADLVTKVRFEPRNLHPFDQHGAFVFLGAFAREDLHVHDDAFDSRRADQRRIADITSLFTEDRAEEFLFRRQLGLAFRRHLSDQNVAGLHVGTDSNDACLIEILQERLADVGDVAGDFLRTKLGIAGFDFKFLDMDRRVVVVLHEALRHQNCVFKVVSAPRHERDEDVASESEFALIRTRTVGKNLSLQDAIAFPHDGLLIDARVLVGAAELGQRIDIRPDFTGEVPILRRLDSDNDALRIDGIHDSAAFADRHGAGVPRRDFFHARSHERRGRLQKRHGLTLHVRTHEGAVRVVILEEGNKRRGHRHELLRRDVHEIHFVPMLQNEVSGLTNVHQFVNELAVLVHFHVRLGNEIFVLFPCRQVERIRKVLRTLPSLVFQLFVLILGEFAFHVLADLELRIAGRNDRYVIDDAAILHFAVRALDKAVFVDARVAAQR